MDRHRSFREWAAYPEFQETPLPEVGGVGAWQGMSTLWTILNPCLDGMGWLDGLGGLDGIGWQDGHTTLTAMS